LIVSILTCDRSPSYIESTLASLRVTATDAEPRLFRDEWPRTVPPEQRLTLSFRRALLESSGDALITEDDVEFRADWPAMLTASVYRCRELVGPRFFLAIYCGFWLPGDRIAAYDPRTFFGTQGQFVPDAARESLAEHLGARRAANTVDALIAEWCDANDVPLFASVPSLVQHVGRVSSLPGGTFHSSPMWDRKH
jgi:hypothetical protein